jgi:hypothetical protein
MKLAVQHHQVKQNNVQKHFAISKGKSNSENMEMENWGIDCDESKSGPQSVDDIVEFMLPSLLDSDPAQKRIPLGIFAQLANSVIF